MSGLARLFVESGALVSGSDLADSVVLEELRTLGVSVAVGHDARTPLVRSSFFGHRPSRVTTSNSSPLEKVARYYCRARRCWRTSRGRARWWA